MKTGDSKLIGMTQMSDENARGLHYINPIKSLPPGTRQRSPFYDDIIKEFMNSNLQYAEVKDLGRKPVTMAFTLKKRIKQKNLQNIQVLFRNKKVYLVRTK